MFNVAIVFNAGSYGTFIEWCLHYFSDHTFSQNMPFTNTGSSHNFQGNHLDNMDNVRRYVNNSSSDKTSIVRFHPKTSKEESILDNLKFVSEYFKKIIFLYPTENSIIWNINNKFEKIWEHGWIYENKDIIRKNLSNWEVNNLTDMQVWQQREMLSLFIRQQHIAETGMNLIDAMKIQFPNILFVSIDDLKDKFYSSMLKIFDYCGIKIINHDNIHFVYKNWISNQYHCNKDILVDTIIKHIINKQYFNLRNKNLTLVDEAFIQEGLRNRGIEIKCYNMNVFPKSINKLQSLLYVTTQ